MLAWLWDFDMFWCIFFIWWVCPTLSVSTNQFWPCWIRLNSELFGQWTLWKTDMTMVKNPSVLAACWTWKKPFHCHVSKKFKLQQAKEWYKLIMLTTPLKSVRSGNMSFFANPGWDDMDDQTMQMYANVYLTDNYYVIIIFKMGWFNHQQVCFGYVFFGPKYLFTKVSGRWPQIPSDPQIYKDVSRIW